MKYFTLCMASALLVWSCQTGGYTISGDLNGISSGRVYLVADGVRMDSAVIRNGRFSMKGCTDSIVIVELAIEDGRIVTPLFLESGRIKIAGNAEPWEISLNGTPNNDAFGRYLAGSRPLTDLAARLKTEIEQAAAGNKMGLVTAGFKRLRDADIQLKRLDSVAIAGQMDVDFGVWLLLKRMSDITVSPVEADSLINIVPVSMHGSPFFRRMKEQRDKIADLEPGGIAPLFEARSSDGGILSPASFLGQYVLIEFWASWCSPCRADIPFLKSTYDKYHSHGFEILGVSFDNSAQAWHDTLVQYDMPWPQVSDLAGIQDSPIAGLYRIVGIPSSWLLDPEGRVIARDLRRGKLDEKLEDIFTAQ